MENIDLTDFFRTKGEGVDFSQRLSRVGDRIYENDFNLDKSLSEVLGLERKDKFMKILRDNGVSENSKTSLADFIKKILDKISATPIVSLIIAFEPTDETLKKLSDWFLLNTKKQAIFDIKVDPQIVAGAQVLAGGRYRDYSVKLKFDEAMKNLITVSADQNKKQEPAPVKQSIEHFVIAR
jgi:hypothetical protein